MTSYRPSLAGYLEQEALFDEVERRRGGRFPGFVDKGELFRALDIMRIVAFEAGYRRGVEDARSAFPAGEEPGLPAEVSPLTRTGDDREDDMEQLYGDWPSGDVHP